jgi:hypothetical protein
MPHREVPFNEQTGVRLVWKPLLEMSQSNGPPESADYLSPLKVRKLEEQERRTVPRDNIAEKP